MPVRISAIFDSEDRADLAVRRLMENGMRIHYRRTTKISHQGYESNATFAAFPGAYSGTTYGDTISGARSEFGYGGVLYTGMEHLPVTPAEGWADETQLEVEVDEYRAAEAVSILINSHGEHVQRF